jgi:hypothetical protein
MTRLWDRWRGYWFRPSPLIDLAVVRILLVALQLAWLLASSQLDLLREAGARPGSEYDPLPALRLLIWPLGAGYRPSLDALLSVRTVTLVAGVLSMLGVATSASLILFTAGNVFLQAYLYSFGHVYHPEALMMISLAILALSPCGRVLSVDSVLKRIVSRSNDGTRSCLGDQSTWSPFARWPLLLLQWMQVLIYSSAALSKLAKSGLDWPNGYTLQYYAFYYGSQLDTRLGVWLSEQHTLAVVLSWITLLFECTFFLVMLKRRLLWIYLTLGTAIHLVIWQTIGATFPQFIVIYAVFIPWGRILHRGVEGRTEIDVARASSDGA